MEKKAQDFCDAWRRGEICLHPTDTLPGLSVDVAQAEALQSFVDWKGRALDKPWVHLAATQTQAFDLWATLPEPWPKALKALWPASLSVVWWDVERKQTLCLRVPKDIPNWMREAVQVIGPLPTTSFNLAGEPPECEWDVAVEKAKQAAFYVPEGFYTSQKKPSTVIRILENGCFEVLREGCVLATDVEKIGQVKRS